MEQPEQQVFVLGVDPLGGLGVDPRRPLAAELDAFLTVVRDGGRPVIDAEDGLWAVGVATSMLDAAARGAAVDLTGLSSRFALA